MKNILVDKHHQGLFDSLIRLFEDRLGYKLYRQIGMEWYEKGFWNVYPHIDTAKQYLQIGNIPKDGTPPLNDDPELARAITFDQFEKMDFDIILASIPSHVKPFKELARIKNAKFIFQMGNVFPEVDVNEIPNLMANTLPKTMSSNCHYVQYHQEINPVFKPSSTSPQPLITSFINVYDHNGGWIDYMALKAALPSHEFKSYGGQCKDGSIAKESDIAAIMHQSQFGFHSKYGGDGFGHVLYSWMACGRPIITRFSDYKGKMGEELLTHMETAIDLDVCSISECSDIIMNMKPLHYIMMCQNARDRFDKCVDYEKEAKDIKKFLEELQ